MCGDSYRKEEVLHLGQDSVTNREGTRAVAERMIGRGRHTGRFWTTMKREMATPRISLMGTVPRCFAYALEAEISK